MTCVVCNGARRVKVGLSFPPRSTISVKVEYDPCPDCTPGPHTFHAKKVAGILRSLSLEPPEPPPGQ